MKVLILLLGIALVPLALVFRLESVSMRRLGTGLAERTREALIREVRLRVLQWIDGKAASVKEGRHLLERTVLAQAREVERCLAAPPTPGVRVYFADDFDRGGPLPPKIETRPGYRRFEEKSSSFKLIPITWEQQVFVLAPGLTRAKAAPDTARLASISAAYRFLRANDESLIYWQYTGLENGLLSMYPGHGGFPAGYDPRQRPWYALARLKEGVTAVGPYISASARELVMTFAAPVRRPDGSFAGVTALDVPLNDLVKNLQLPPGWPADAVAMLVSAADRGDGARALKVLARPGSSARGQAWNRDLKTEWLESSDAEGMRKMMDDIKQGVSSARLMPFGGRACLWGYGPVGQEALFLVAILPYHQITAAADAAQRDAIAQTRSHLRKVGLLSALVIAAVILIAWLASRAFSRPIRELAGAARRVAEGLLDTRVNIRTRDEIEELGDAFNRMVPQLQDRLRIKQSLELAREVQQHLLPSAPPRVPGLDVAGRSLSCDETGGDYYDYLPFSREGRPHLGVAVGDVTGHGVAAAMLMATARALLRGGCEEVLPLAKLMTRINRQLAGDVSGGRFMTLFYLIVDAARREARWVSAGHEPAIHYRAADDSFQDLGEGGLPFAIDPTVVYAERGPQALQPGDVIVMGTDGIWETRNPGGEMFGKDALREIVRRQARLPADRIADAVVEAVARFRGTRPQADDLTLVVVKVSA